MIEVPRKMCIRDSIEGFSIGNICLGIDLTIIMIYASVFKSLNNALYGALALYITTKVLDLSLIHI